VDSPAPIAMEGGRERERWMRLLSDPAWCDTRCDTQLGTKPEFSFPVKDHLELAEALGMVDFERAAEVSGSKFYYLKGMGAMLELALVNWAMQKVRLVVVAAAAAAHLPPLRSQPSGNVGFGHVRGARRADVRLKGTAWSEWLWTTLHLVALPSLLCQFQPLVQAPAQSLHPFQGQ
jgi:hypothetical protein